MGTANVMVMTMLMFMTVMASIVVPGSLVCMDWNFHRAGVIGAIEKIGTACVVHLTETSVHLSVQESGSEGVDVYAELIQVGGLSSWVVAVVDDMYCCTCLGFRASCHQCVNLAFVLRSAMTT